MEEASWLELGARGRESGRQSQRDPEGPWKFPEAAEGTTSSVHGTENTGQQLWDVCVNEFFRLKGGAEFWWVLERHALLPGFNLDEWQSPGSFLLKATSLPVSAGRACLVSLQHCPGILALQ